LGNRYVFGIFSERAEELLANLQKTTTTAGQVNSLLMPLVHTGHVGIEQIATKLGLNRISLYRRLKAEGTTYEKILTNLRLQLALSYLSSQKTSVSDVAYLVGFTDPAAFSRAFKRWTGKSPSLVKCVKG
jgi:AraC-like DNA-binding protein